MVDFSQDFVDAFGPCEGFQVSVVGFYVLLDGLDQFLHAFENAAANPFAGDFTMPPFDQIQAR